LERGSGLQDEMKTSELASIFGVSAETVRKLARSGVIVRAGRLFPVAESVRRYAAHLRDAAAGRGKASGGEAAVSARARLADLQADAQEMKNAVARGELISEAEVDSAWAEVALLVRTAVMDGVERAAGELPHMSRSDVAVLDRVMRGALTALRQPQT
jgi:terminase small subunit / prophage DNA-packing protein